MRRVALAVHRGGLVVTVFGIGKLHAVRHGYDYTGSIRFAWSAVYVVALGAAAYALGIPDLPRSRRRAIGAGVAASALGAAAVSAGQLLLNTVLLPRMVVFGAGLVAVPWALLCTALARDGHQHDELLDRVLVVAAPGRAEELSADLARSCERPAVVVASLPVADSEAHRLSARPLCEAASASGATIVVLDRAAQASEAVVAQVAELHARGVRVRTLSLFYEEWLGKIPLGELEHLSLMFDIGELHRTYYTRAKRVVDVGVAVVGVAVLAAAVPVVAAANLVANRGPLFYRQERVGKGGRVFTMVKFRSMRPGDGSAWTARDDPRITRFGRVLRATHLDELPQVLNVLRGDLSIVGPRPEQPHYVDELSRKVPFYDFRHLVRPGLSGWRQVKYGYAGSEDEALEGLQYDFFYLRRQCVALDLRIIGRTVRLVLGKEGR